MAKYKISIEELLQKVVEVEAETPAEAFKKVEKDYKAGKIKLTAEDISEFCYGIIEEKEAAAHGDQIPAEACGEI